ncbi:hypothetical protein FEM48_Zijuj02G0024000 [Ziziphus jujuba var. spinosa]|uniref:PRA1 family protein n=1 Tax=Ziziphus jujuba var. spinosa TaxID=714518 RepID=A0A978VT27_ZIZJJ|nr:hypothetical protein FEM48_Zijuj02G0024000 [Ziziphus jujuba var. spinosa]
MALSIPNSLVEATRRVEYNFRNFTTHYAILIFYIFFLSIFGNSSCMVILINVVFVCFLVYLNYQHPMVLFNCRDDIIDILAFLGAFTIWAMIFVFDICLNLWVSFWIASALAGLHALLWETEAPTTPAASDAAV